MKRFDESRIKVRFNEEGEEFTLPYSRGKRVLNASFVSTINSVLDNPDFNHGYFYTDTVEIPFTYECEYCSLILGAEEVLCWDYGKDNHYYSIRGARFKKNGPIFIEFECDNFEANIWFDEWEKFGKFIADNLPMDAWEAFNEHKG